MSETPKKKKLPDAIPTGASSPKWRFSKSDWIAPVALFVTMLATLSIEQILVALSNNEPISWTAIFVVPLLLVIRNFLSNGGPNEMPKELRTPGDDLLEWSEPFDVSTGRSDDQ